MTIDFETEELIHFTDAANFFPGRKPCIQSLHRWRLHGVTGAKGEKVKLETVKVSGLRYTSQQAIRRFIEAQNATDTPAPGVSAKQRRQQSEAARKALAEIGI